MSEKLALTTEDGATVVAQVFKPALVPKAVVIINPAMAVTARFYRHFANFLAEQGYLTVTYDYRGMGESRCNGQQDINLLVWAKKDFSCIVDYAEKHFPGLRLFVIGHSFGGQVPRLSHQTARIKGILAISAQSGYWRLWPLHQQVILIPLWYFFMPALAKIIGFFPAKSLRLGQNLPAGAALQWAEWCRHKHYFYKDAEHIPEFDLSKLNIRFIGFSDDWMAPKAAIEALQQSYVGARLETEYFSPQQLHLNKIGHFGFFKQTMRETLWERSLEWLDAF